MIKLLEHQINSINNTINQNFISGIHCHATGSGKTIIAGNIVLEYNKRNKNNNVIWFTERKSILIEKLVKQNLKKNISELWNKFEIIEFAYNKIKIG